MLNMKIGESRAFRCVEVKDEDNCCVGCMFNDESCCWVDVEISGHCSVAFREDKKDVIFVRADPNEIIRERIERQIDRFNDNGFVRIAFKEGDCICLKASFMKDYLFTLLEVLPEPKKEKEESKC